MACIGGHMVAAFIGVACARGSVTQQLRLLLQFCYEVVAVNADLMVLLAIILNNVVPGRRYPMLHTHHAHHSQFSQQQHSELLEEDFNWALSQMDGVIDVSAEDLVDIYEFPLERAQTRRAKHGAINSK
ncbi:MAG TPA: HPP family protein [Methylotenera sp.]|nr:HPP family protein [Methylotenera sp.]